MAPRLQEVLPIHGQTGGIHIREGKKRVHHTAGRWKHVPSHGEHSSFVYNVLYKGYCLESSNMDSIA